MFQYNDYTTDVWLLKLSEQQDPFRFRMHAQRVCIIAAYPVLRLCDASNIAALSAHGVSNTELPHEFAPLSLHPNPLVAITPVEILYTMLEGLHLPIRDPCRWLCVATETSINPSLSLFFFLLYSIDHLSQRYLLGFSSSRRRIFRFDQSVFSVHCRVVGHWL